MTMKHFLKIATWATGPLLTASPVLAARSETGGYTQTNLVASSAEYAPLIIDPAMRNAWGLALRPPGAAGHIWISNAKTGTSSEYIGDVGEKPLHQDGLKLVTLACPAFTDQGIAFVTGQAYNAASDFPGQPVEFPISGPATNLTTTPPTPVGNGYEGAAKFAFVTMDGCINAWSAGTTVSMDNAPVIVDYSKTSEKIPSPANCVFTGTAFTLNRHDSAAFKTAGGNRLFACDFRNNLIRVFDNKWKDVTDAFKFQKPPTVGGLHPFNIADINGRLFVSYAMFDENSDEGQEQVPGAGYGHIVEYGEDGTLVRDYTDTLALNTPWGLAVAPASFGEYAGCLLVANFGDGTIAAYNRISGKFAGYLRDADTRIIVIDGIWALAFGNGDTLGKADALYFTAGPNGEAEGLFGRLDSLHLEIEKIENAAGAVKR